jgi:hypothetical protein
MHEDVRIRVTEQSHRVGDLAPSENEGPSFDQTMDIESETDPKHIVSLEVG